MELRDSNPRRFVCQIHLRYDKAYQPGDQLLFCIWVGASYRPVLISCANLLQPPCLQMRLQSMPGAALDSLAS